MAKPLNVLIGCEESGTVREAFRALGHNAWSNDLGPARDNSRYHITGDVRLAIRGGVPAGEGAVYRHGGVPWDLLIAFPPCTYLCNSGVRWFTTIPKIQKPGVRYGWDRKAAMAEGVELFAACYNAGIEKVAIENPVMHGHARELLAGLGVPTFDQSIQPWQFGHGEVKRTCLWLRGLPQLQPTAIVEGRHAAVHKMGPSDTRARDRSVTYQGIADAMAAQWGGVAK